MKIKGNHFQRYKQIAKLLWKYGRSDLVGQMGIDDALDEADLKAAPAPGDTLPEQLADDLEAMGPTYVKLGQLLASRPDMLPDAYIRALARLHDKVKPFPYEQVEEIVAAELGVRISKAFSRFDSAPIAAAFNKRIAQLVVDSQAHGIRQVNVGRTLLEATRTATELSGSSCRASSRCSARRCCSWTRSVRSSIPGSTRMPPSAAT